MSIKWFGALLIILSCGGFGFMIAAAHRREETTLRQLIAALDFMECELQFRLPPLPELCRQVATESTGVIRTFFQQLAQELENQISPDVESCINAVLGRARDIPQRTLQSLQLLKQSLGRFDIEGQLLGLEAVRQGCRQKAEALAENRDVRLRSYQTLGLCAGAALAILFI